MRNNYGYGKYEVLTVIVLILVIFAYLMHVALKGANNQKISTMEDSAIGFSKAVTTNISSFHNTETVYLNEVINEQLLSNIKSPFSSNYCDGTSSKVELLDGQPYVTLKCDEFLIEKAAFFNKKDIPVYKVSGWSETRNSADDEEKTLYNCIVDGKELYDEYYEELYFVSKINEDFGTANYFADSINGTCQVLTKTFYRKKEIYK